jgi:hypothetical protein
MGFDTESNWGEWDRIDGVRIKGGEVIDVTWPNKETTRHIVQVIRYPLPINDMGHEYNGQDDRAIIKIDFNGCKIPVELRGLKVKVRRLTK